MLVTDGVPYSFEDIFRQWNWEREPKTPVRVFTYLIGREVADVREVKWMACANKGTLLFIYISICDIFCKIKNSTKLHAFHFNNLYLFIF